MVWVGIVILAVMLLIVGGLFVEIIVWQKKLDAPCKGVLIIDRQDPEAPCMVYLQANVDPDTLTNGELVKFRVRTVTDKSQ